MSSLPYPGPRIRLRTHEDGSLILSGPNGEPGPPALNVTIHTTPHGAIAAVEYLEPQLDVIADVATLTRLEAAEEATRLATHLMYAVMAERPTLPALRGLYAALNKCRALAGERPLREITPDVWQRLAKKCGAKLDLSPLVRTR